MYIHCTRTFINSKGGKLDNSANKQTKQIKTEPFCLIF